MAEPSLLCVSCGLAPPPHRRTWSRCTICVERNLPATYYCGEECMNAHWPKHKEYHKVQKKLATSFREGTLIEGERLAAAVEARRAQRTGDEYDEMMAAAAALSLEDDHHAEAKIYRKMIKKWPAKPGPYFELGVTLQRSNRYAEAGAMHLKAMELAMELVNAVVATPCGSRAIEAASARVNEFWARAAAAAFDVLKMPSCTQAPKPEWWNDEGLKALSARVVAAHPGDVGACAMRGLVLSGDQYYAFSWNVGTRTSAEIKEAATWYRRAASLSKITADRKRFERDASSCDEFADPLLAEEQTKAAKALAAAEAEAAKAHDAAEAKALAAAEELLAEEEKEKTHAAASTKAKAKGKKAKGKGNR